MWEDGAIESARRDRYAGWETADAQAMLTSDLGVIEAQVRARRINPVPRSGRQERLENLVNRYV
jgi:xylose isomerase